MSYALIDVPGGAETYSVPFPYINRSHVKVMVNGVLTTNFSWINNDTISITPTPGANDKVRIYRNTSQAERLVDFRAGVAPTETTLDTDSTQAFYLAQEALDRAGNSLTLDPEDFLWDARGIKMKNVAPATDDLDVPLYGQIKPAVVAAEAARDLTLSYRNQTAALLSDAEEVLEDAEDARDAAAASALLASTFVPDNYYTKSATDLLLAAKATITDLVDGLATKLNLTGGTLTGLLEIVRNGPSLSMRDGSVTTTWREILAAYRGDGTGNAFRILLSGNSSNAVIGTRFNIGNTTHLELKGDGRVSVGADPTDVQDIATKQYVDRYYESAELSAASGSDHTFNHGLGVKPRRIDVFLRCVTSEYGWSVGDEVTYAHFSSSTTLRGAFGYIHNNTTSAGVRISNQDLVVISKTNGSFVTITPANWRVIARVYP